MYSDHMLEVETLEKPDSIRDSVDCNILGSEMKPDLFPGQGELFNKSHSRRRNSWWWWWFLALMLIFSKKTMKPSWESQALGSDQLPSSKEPVFDIQTRVIRWRDKPSDLISSGEFILGLEGEKQNYTMKVYGRLVEDNLNHYETDFTGEHIFLGMGNEI